MERQGCRAEILAAGLSLAVGCSTGTTGTADDNTATGSTSTTTAGSSATQAATGATTTTGNASSSTATTGGATTATSSGTQGAGETASDGTMGTTSNATGGGTGGGATDSGTTGGGTTGDGTTGGGTTGGGTTGGGTTGGGIGDYNPDFEEEAGEDCELPEPMSLGTPDHSLPDPFLMPDGTRMSSVSEWACQRAWLKKKIEAFVHGEKPGRPDVVTGSVSTTSVDVHVEQGGSSADFSISINLPPGANGPVPGMFQADGSGVPTNFLHGEGVAAMRYDHGDAESAFNAIYGSGGVSVQIKWAWAVSRAIDVLVDERDAGNNDIIDPTGLGTTGCSYAGKSAFTVGAFDERIALGIPVESGTGGLGSYRVVADNDLGPNGGENPEQVSEACGQNWLIAPLCSGNVDSIPADAHFMVAMYAPRGFTTLDNNRIGHLGPVAQYAAAAAGAEVFKALGVESHVGYHGGNDTDPHQHCSFNASQEETARRAIRGFLTKTEAPANFMEPKLKNQSDQAVNFDLTSYIDWDTPALN